MIETETAAPQDQARHYLALLEREFQRWCDDGDMASYRTRNGMIWNAIRAAGPDVESMVQKGLDRGE